MGIAKIEDTVGPQILRMDASVIYAEKNYNFKYTWMRPIEKYGKSSIASLTVMPSCIKLSKKH